MVPNKNSIYPSPDNLKSNIFFEIGDILNVCVVANSAGVTLSSWLALILLLITEEANKAKEVNTILPIDAEKKKKNKYNKSVPSPWFLCPLAKFTYLQNFSLQWHNYWFDNEIILFPHLFLKCSTQKIQ